MRRYKRSRRSTRSLYTSMPRRMSSQRRNSPKSRVKRPRLKLRRKPRRLILMR